MAVFSVLGRSVALVSDWAESVGHEVAILVTVRGPSSNPDQHLSTIASARHHTSAMVVPTVTGSEAALARARDRPRDRLVLSEDP